MGRSRIRTRDVIILTVACGLAFVVGYMVGFGAALDMMINEAQKYLNFTIPDDILKQLLLKYGLG